MASAAAREASAAHDAIGHSMVPHYDMFGNQHNREPFKDKSHLLGQDIRHPQWLDPPPDIKSRSELQQARKRGKVPDMSYDFDRDGVVGQLDYFVGRCFDKDADGRLTRSERGRAEKALQDGFLDGYVRGLDSQGSKMRPDAVVQKRGVIARGDNPADISRFTYPPHFNAAHYPEHSTKTALELSRLAEAKGHGSAIGERWIAANANIPEPPPPNAKTVPRVCPISHIRERAMADHQEARVRAGLLPAGEYVNPERETRTVSLTYVDKPAYSTITDLQEARRQEFKKECKDLRIAGNANIEPREVRKTRREILAYEFRRPDHEPMTLTRLKEIRRQDKIEHDMNNFAYNHPRKDCPKFSDNPEKPFWEAEREAHGHEPPHRPANRSVSEPLLNVTHAPHFKDASTAGAASTSPVFSHTAGVSSSTEELMIGSNTVKRWTSEQLHFGQGRNKPRLFDNIQPVRVGPKDLESLDLTSSMEPVRNAALQKRADDRRANVDNPRRSRLWSDPSLAQPSGCSSGPVRAGGKGDTPVSPRRTSKATGQRRSPRHGQNGSGDSVDVSGANVSSVAKPPQDISAGSTVLPSRRQGAGMRQVASDPSFRTFGTQEVKACEPKFFGSATPTRTRQGEGTVARGVRCGGFQRVDRPAPNLQHR